MNELSLVRHPSVQTHLPTLYLFCVSNPVIASISSIFCFTNMPFTDIMSSEIVAPDTTGTFGTFTLVGVVTFYSPVIGHKNKNRTWIAKASPGPTPAGTTTLTVPLGPSTAIIWPGFTPCRSHAKMKITLCRWHACGALRFIYCIMTIIIITTNNNMNIDNGRLTAGTVIVIVVAAGTTGTTAAAIFRSSSSGSKKL